MIWELIPSRFLGARKNQPGPSGSPGIANSKTPLSKCLVLLQFLKKNPFGESLRRMPARTRPSDGPKNTGTSERSSAWTTGGDFAHLQVLFSLSILTTSPQHPPGEAVAGYFAQPPSSLLPPVPSARSVAVSRLRLKPFLNENPSGSHLSATAATETSKAR